MGMPNMFDLVSAEGRLFANKILLRLADAFQDGDNHTRSYILRILLLELKQHKKTGNQYKGIFSKKGVENYLKLLRRVKVFQTDDVESRTFVLCLLGCWAGFALGSIEIPHLILSSLESHKILEVRVLE